MVEENTAIRQIPLTPSAIKENVEDQYLIELATAERALELAIQWGQMNPQVATLDELYEAKTKVVHATEAVEAEMPRLGTPSIQAVSPPEKGVY